jgi:hypothetical protein
MFPSNRPYSRVVGVKRGNVPTSGHVELFRNENRMPIESITLHCVRKDGRRETTELPGHTMSDARELAKWVDAALVGTRRQNTRRQLRYRPLGEDENQTAGVRIRHTNTLQNTCSRPRLAVARQAC